MSSPGPAFEISDRLRELLSFDRSLSPSERKVLASLLLQPGSVTARDLARRTGTNVQGLYPALDRLERRGLIVRDVRPGGQRIRASPASTILPALVEPTQRAAALSAELLGPLEELARAADAREAPHSPPPVESTATTTRAVSGWLVELLDRSTGDVWFLGDESAWFPPGGAVERSLARRRERGTSPPVRMLVPPPMPTDVRTARHGALRSGGVTMRYSGRFAAPAVIVDGRWLLLRTGAPGGNRRETSGFVKLDSPELCRDLLRAGLDAWALADSPEHRRPGTPPTNRLGSRMG